MSRRDELLARYRDEHAGPPNGTEVAVRCTVHGRFLVWCSPPAPDVDVACPPACCVDEQPGPALRVGEP